MSLSPPPRLQSSPPRQPPTIFSIFFVFFPISFFRFFSNFHASSMFSPLLPAPATSKPDFKVQTSNFEVGTLESGFKVQTSYFDVGTSNHNFKVQCSLPPPLPRQRPTIFLFFFFLLSFCFFSTPNFEARLQISNFELRSSNFEVRVQSSNLELGTSLGTPWSGPSSM